MILGGKIRCFVGLKWGFCCQLLSDFWKLTTIVKFGDNKKHRKYKGFLCFEFGLGQERAVCEILKENDYIILELRKDLGGIVRAVLAQKKERYRCNGNG